CLQYALEAACRNARLKRCPVALIGLGKLGGRELTYGSDLDVVFVAEDKVQRQLPKLQKLAVDMMDLLGAQTELGIAFVIDARLRPDGEKGLLKAIPSSDRKSTRLNSSHDQISYAVFCLKKKKKKQKATKKR